MRDELKKIDFNKYAMYHQTAEEMTKFDQSINFHESFSLQHIFDIVTGILLEEEK